MERAPSPVPTLEQLRPWCWLVCEHCLHRKPVAFVPLITRRGPHASSEPASAIGALHHVRRGASAPELDGMDLAWAPFPVSRQRGRRAVAARSIQRSSILDMMIVISRRACSSFLAAATSESASTSARTVDVSAKSSCDVRPSLGKQWFNAATMAAFAACVSGKFGYKPSPPRSSWRTETEAARVFRWAIVARLRNAKVRRAMRSFLGHQAAVGAPMCRLPTT